MKKCITTVYYLINNFCKVYLEWEQNKLLTSNKKRQRDGSLGLCELMTIVLYFILDISNISTIMILYDMFIKNDINYIKFPILFGCYSIVSRILTTTIYPDYNIISDIRIMVELLFNIFFLFGKKHENILYDIFEKNII